MPNGRKKPRASLRQMVFFSVGHIMNDLVNTIYTSYLLIFQTKILGLPSNIVGLLWLIPAGIDAFLAILIGHASDNVVIPYLSKVWGKRKAWHLIGCTLVGVCSPFFLMPCFLCGDEATNWKIILYYASLLVCSYSGWNLTQSNFLALIPVVAKRQSEMVKLGAANSAITLICGMFVYIVTWALLRSDSSETLSFAQWKKFMYLVIIVVGTGAFFSLMFHLGTHEPTSRETGSNANHPKTDISKPSPSSAHEFSDKEYGEHVIHQSPMTTHAYNVSDVIQGLNDTALVNPSFIIDDENGSSKTTNQNALQNNKNKGMVDLEVTELEAVLWEALAQKNKEKDDDVSSIETSGYGEDSGNEEITSEETSDAETVELPMPITFMDMVPNHSELMLHSQRSSTRTTPVSSPRLSRSASKRFNYTHQGSDNLYNTVLKSRLNSVNSRMSSPLSTPRLYPRSTKLTPWTVDITPTNSKTGHQDDIVIENISIELSKTSAIEDPVEKKSDLTIIERSETMHQNGNGQEKKTCWKTLFRKPEFYKLAGAYLFTRVSQNITTSYLPLFLTDYLKFGKEAIAYFPLVYLLSGVFASFAAKRFTKLLGNKWTFCLGSVLVMGASGWFYLLTEENRNVTYVPAVLSGCGTSIMFVTTLALAAEFVDADRSSGAFVIASMSFLCKVVMGLLFGLLQEYSPKATSPACPECTSYIHYVFSLTPGVSALFGLIAFILFIPATIQCRPITHTVEAETQTDESPSDNEEIPPSHPLEVIMELNEKETSPSPVKITIDAETQTEELLLSPNEAEETLAISPYTTQL